MITIDEAILRGHRDTWHAGISETEAETAYQDRTVLAMEVVAMRETLLECEKEVAYLRREIDGDLPPFD